MECGQKQFMKPESHEGQLFCGPVRSLGEQVFLNTQYTVNQEAMWALTTVGQFFLFLKIQKHF